MIKKLIPYRSIYRQKKSEPEFRNSNYLWTTAFARRFGICREGLNRRTKFRVQGGYFDQMMLLTGFVHNIFQLPSHLIVDPIRSALGTDYCRDIPDTTMPNPNSTEKMVFPCFRFPPHKGHWKDSLLIAISPPGLIILFEMFPIGLVGGYDETKTRKFIKGYNNM